MPRNVVGRSARARAYLMCAPDYFSVQYAINPWMDPARPVDVPLALEQWRNLCDVLRSLGHRVELAEPQPGLPDMVFTANAATVIDGRVLVATFRHRERSGESYLFEQWFRWRGYRQVRRARGANEGEGDHLLVDGVILAGHGLRTDPESHPETSGYFGRPVVGLTLVDPRFYHLDTALAVLGGREIMYYPAAFSGASVDRLRALFPDAIEADDEGASVFGLNAISDGRHVVLPAAATRLADLLARRVRAGARRARRTAEGRGRSQVLRSGAAVRAERSCGARPSRRTARRTARTPGVRSLRPWASPDPSVRPCRRRADRSASCWPSG